MGCEYSDLKKLQDNLVELEQQKAGFCEKMAKELAARLLSQVIKRTPVGDYTRYLFVDTQNERIKYAHFKTKNNKSVTFRVKPKTRGTLRRGWTGEKRGGTKGDSQIAKLAVRHFGGTYSVEIINPVEYASYVEFGHRKVGGGWVPGRFMLTMSETELRSIAPALIEKQMAKWLEGNGYK